MTTTTTTTARAAIEQSIRVIAEGQAPSGAYIASPHFPEYAYGWLRDGAYVALAMDAVGERDSAAAFHAWAARVIDSQAARIEWITVQLREGRRPGSHEMLPTRYTLDGEPEVIVGEAWPNFQLDGYGTWLFALHRHLGGQLEPVFEPSVRLAADYLQACWQLPCFDYWEESGDRQHTSTLAAIAAGLRAAAALLGEPVFEQEAKRILRFIRDECVSEGCFVKGPLDTRVDASLVSLATPFGLVERDDPEMAATIQRIRAELSSPSGGIWRYRGDSYYGGNPWLLLTAWLGWHDRLGGNEQGYLHARDWVLAHSRANGDMPEQITDEAQAPEYLSQWEQRWGPIASPLLWSHAKFILLELGSDSAWS